MYSQNQEEQHILEYFKDQPTGKFIDIGAYDVFRFSNTRALYEKGWEGILVEPAPTNYRAIADHYKDEPRIKVLNDAIGVGTCLIDFYESDGDAVGTTDKAHMEKWAAAGVKYTKIEIGQADVEDFLTMFGEGTDFLSIDTESTNMELFRHIPSWVFEQIKLFCIEHDGLWEEIETTLTPFGFTKLHLNAENIILGKNAQP